MFEKFDKKVARGCLAAFASVVVLCAVGGFNFWHYMFIDEPMVVAAMECDYDGVKQWLNRGADPNSTWDGGSDSALHFAKQCKDQSIVELLKSRGATE